MAGIRPKRLAEQVQRELAKIINLKIKDPEKGLITLTGVHITNDLSIAKIKYTAVDNEGKPSRETAQKVLDRANGYIRHELAAEIRVRSVPSLIFIYDDSMDKIREIDKLIHKIHSKDE